MVAPRNETTRNENILRMKRGERNIKESWTGKEINTVNRLEIYFEGCAEFPLFEVKN